VTSDLTDRQISLLKFIIEEYIKTAEPVGSQNLVKNSQMGVSPATVRNEMARLMQKGYLEMPHTSSGRVPTTLGLRFYVNSLMQEEDLPVLQEVSLKQKLWEQRESFEKLLRQAALALSEVTKGVAVVTTDDGHLFYAGPVNLLDHPEFYDIDVTRAVLHLLDNHSLVSEIIGKAEGEKESHIMIGEELELSNLKTCGFVFSRYSLGEVSGIVGVIGPARMPYAKIIPVIKYVKNLILEAREGLV